ncbi:MFS transporter [Blastopirellula marina]|uniref:MFS transporter n=1 Tax=Blastopirellula marina TaxID=124 RepID=A0A2S8FSG1_9BACT|nr:MFS transporter [Blastopirellula marina]PQO35122.1 MFS transporter [Blastopirellula marina]PQO43451.1 MFS transporter [Blastopirellula marina]PTL43871.1 MFS transporter [Blastopirellula marina]
MAGNFATTSSASQRPGGIVRALAHRNYRLFLVGQSVSLIGTWMQQTALAWLVYEMTNSPLLLGIVAFAGQIPTFFLAPIAGALSDQVSRRRTLLVTQAIAMSQAAILAALMWTGHIEVWQIIVLNLILGVTNAFDMPTRQAFLVDMVPDRNDLPNAIALNSSIVTGSRLVGPFGAGLMLAWFGAIPCFMFNAVSYGAVIGAYLLMRDLPQVRRVPGARLGAGIIEGFRYAFGSPPICMLLLLVGMVSMMGMPMSVLLPAVASEVLHGGPDLFGLLTGATGVGALAAAIYLASRRTVLGLARRMALSGTFYGLAMITFAFSRSVPLSLGLLIVTGFTMMMQMAGGNTLIQTIVDEDKRGRVMSLYTMAIMGMAPIGSLVAGAIANHFGTTVAITISGSCCLAGSIGFAWMLPRLRKHVAPIYRAKGVLPEVAEGLEASSEFQVPPERAA